jgi:hypothetical protein
MKTRILGLAIISLAAVACTKDPGEAIPAPYSGNITEMKVPDGFKFNTSQDVSVSVSVNDLNDIPLNGVLVKFYTDDPARGGQRIATSLTWNGVAESDN